MNPYSLARFTVAGYDGESLQFTMPVQVSCSRCGESSPVFGAFPGTGDGASLAELVVWGQQHVCREQVPRLRRARALAGVA